MPNVVEIVIKGKDQTGQGLDSATAKMATIGQQGKALGRGFSELGQISQTLGNTHIAGLAQQSSNLIQVIESLGTMMQRVTARALAIGAAIAVVGFLISKYVEMKEAAKKAEEANKELTKSIEDMQLQQLRVTKNSLADAKEAEIQHKRRMEQILEQLDAGADVEKAEQAKAEADRLFQQEMLDAKLTDYEKYKQEVAKLDEQFNAGQVATYIQNLNDVSGALMADMEGKKALLSTYRDFWMESHRTMFSYVAEGTKTVASGLGSAIVDVAMGAKDAATAFKELGLSIAKMFVTFIVQRAIAFIAEKALAAVGLSLAVAQTQAVNFLAASSAAAWAPAATASLIATFGASASAAGLLAPLMAANQVAATGLSLAGGVAHGGADYIPQESTYLLNKGERVLSPNQNEDLTNFLQVGHRGGGYNIDGRKLGDALYEMSRDGRLRIDGRAIV